MNFSGNSYRNIEGFDLIPKNSSNVTDDNYQCSDDYIISGNNVQKIKNTSMLDCKNECLDDEDCIGFNYGTETKECFLKKNVSSFKKSPDCTLCIKKSLAPGKCSKNNSSVFNKLHNIFTENEQHIPKLSHAHIETIVKSKGKAIPIDLQGKLSKSEVEQIVRLNVENEEKLKNFMESEGIENEDDLKQFMEDKGIKNKTELKKVIKSKKMRVENKIKTKNIENKNELRQFIKSEGIESKTTSRKSMKSKGEKLKQRIKLTDIENENEYENENESEDIEHKKPRSYMKSKKNNNDDNVDSISVLSSCLSASDNLCPDLFNLFLSLLRIVSLPFFFRINAHDLI